MLGMRELLLAGRLRPLVAAAAGVHSQQGRAGAVEHLSTSVAAWRGADLASDDDEPAAGPSEVGC